jgi:hypothetical protein
MAGGKQQMKAMPIALGGAPPASGGGGGSGGGGRGTDALRLLPAPLRTALASAAPVGGAAAPGAVRLCAGAGTLLALVVVAWVGLGGGDGEEDAAGAHGPRRAGSARFSGLAKGGDDAGGGCGTGNVRDCDGQCAPAEWLGDGWCDADEDGLALNCSGLDWDGGDCLLNLAPCAKDQVRDCRGHCAPASWVGDGTCDLARQDFRLNCSALRWDGGDCLLGPDGCPAGQVALCQRAMTTPATAAMAATVRCVPTVWLGDGECDAEIKDAHGVLLGSLNCSAADFDGQDCVLDSVGCLGHEIRGCDGSCITSSLVGDGYCDEECSYEMVRGGYCEMASVKQHRFNCSRLRFDGGDCLVDPASGCWGGHKLDCRGQCAPQEYIGDGVCDEPRQDFWLNCSETGWDGGDCLP